MNQPFWRTSLSAIEPNKILIRGYRVQDLMAHCSFGDIIYLTFKGELPAHNEGRLIEMIVVSSTDHSFLAPSIDATRFRRIGRSAAFRLRSRRNPCTWGPPWRRDRTVRKVTTGEHKGGRICPSDCRRLPSRRSAYLVLDTRCTIAIRVR